ncbi:hypothetical protein [Bradyrhizobium prioriisuperbiae]|uniref:hypothetical protein n=1 Tax=Bradyrhizobium prioriisuperbiae TaxID=2854389 RepID=UPI0028F0967E|nr:hypothetical protein [Bradyrhizobium prioritasuperba]
MEPASIRYRNPGAMWGNALAIKWGAAKKAVTLNDGKGQGNNIAVFPTFVAGICAQLDLWRTSKNYRNKRFADAIATWSGHNNVPSYIAFCKARVPGLTENTVMNDAFWKSAMGISFLKAQAWHEAGKVYPAPDADWLAAQKRVLSGVPTANTVKKAVVSVTTSTAATTAAATQAGMGMGTAVLIGVGIAVAVFLAWKFWPRKPEQDLPHPDAVAPSVNTPVIGDVTPPAVKTEVSP